MRERNILSHRGLKSIGLSPQRRTAVRNNFKIVHSVFSLRVSNFSLKCESKINPF